MPFLSGRFYMNPAYGHAVERARGAEAGFDQHEPDQHEPDAHWVTIDGNHVLIHETQAGRQHHAPQHRGHVVESKAQIANRIYNETSGLRPTTRSGPGSAVDLHNARVYAGAVARNIDASGKPVPIAPNQLSKDEVHAVTVYPPARAAYNDSLDAAQQAITGGDPTGGATHYYLDHGQPKPPWAVGKDPVASFGPFVNEAGGGDVPKGAKVTIRVYRF